MTLVYDMSDKLVFIVQNNKLITKNNEVLAELKDHSITDILNRNLGAISEDYIIDKNGNKLVYLFFDTAYSKGRELCRIVGGKKEEQALGAAGFYYFGN
jgi:hypothetical protein